MLEKFGTNFQAFYTENVINYVQDLLQSPRKNYIVFNRYINSVFFSKEDNKNSSEY